MSGCASKTTAPHRPTRACVNSRRARHCAGRAKSSAVNRGEEHGHFSLISPLKVPVHQFPTLMLSWAVLCYAVCVVASQRTPVSHLFPLPREPSTLARHSIPFISNCMSNMPTSLVPRVEVSHSALNRNQTSKQADKHSGTGIGTTPSRSTEQGRSAWYQYHHGHILVTWPGRPCLPSNGCRAVCRQCPGKVCKCLCVR